MLPSGVSIEDVIDTLEENEQENTQTFGIFEILKTKKNNAKSRSINPDEESEDIITHYVGSKIDDLEAVKQSIYLMLNIEADQYIIYPWTYGINTLDLIGKPHYYVMAVLPNRIKETLMSDDRITDVTDFEFNVDRNKLTVKFIAHTIYGDVDEETVVSY